SLRLLKNGRGFEPERMDICDEDQQPSQLVAPYTMPNSDACLMELMVSPPAFASPIISPLTPSPAAGTRTSRCREMDGGLCRGPWCRTVVMRNKSLAQMNKTQGGGQSDQGALALRDAERERAEF